MTCTRWIANPLFPRGPGESSRVAEPNHMTRPWFLPLAWRASAVSVVGQRIYLASAVPAESEVTADQWGDLASNAVGDE